METFEDLCKKAGLRVTPQRVAVYQALMKTDRHPSAEMVYKEVRKELPNVSYDTVNRTLVSLVDAGAAIVVDGGSGMRRFDGDVKAHQHFRCIKCGVIFDFHHEPFDDLEVPKGIAEKCVVLRKAVIFEGYCNQCKE